MMFAGFGVEDAMSTKTPEILETRTEVAKQTAEQMTRRSQEAITNYFTGLQNAMSASPWGSTEMHKKLVSFATETITAPFAFMQKLSQAKNLEDVIKIQTEFVKQQTDSFNETAKQLGEICSKVANSATKTLTMST
jgi:hypothetical protein